MTTFSRRLLSSTIALTLTLGLVACNSADDAEAELVGEPIAAIAAPEGQQWTDTVQVTERGGYLQGNPAAPIKLIEYGSLTCPACAAFAGDAAEPLRANYVNTGRVSFEFRSIVIHGPLDLVLTRLIGCGPKEAAQPLADQIWANLATIQQNAYANQPAFEAALQLPEDQRFVALANVAGLYDFFAARGLSEDQARTCLADFSEMKRLADLSQTYAEDDGVSRTPTFTLNGRMMDESSWTAVEAALQRAGAR